MDKRHLSSWDGVPRLQVKETRSLPLLSSHRQPAEASPLWKPPGLQSWRSNFPQRTRHSPHTRELHPGELRKKHHELLGSCSCLSSTPHLPHPQPQSRRRTGGAAGGLAHPRDPRSHSPKAAPGGPRRGLSPGEASP